MTTRVPRRTALRSAAAAVVGATAGAATACTSSGSRADSSAGTRGASGRRAEHRVRPRGGRAAGVLDPATVRGKPRSEATLVASRALLEEATAVVVASDAPDDVRHGTTAARRLGIPLLVAGPGLVPELDRLGTRTVLRYAGHAAATGSASPSPAPADLGDREVVEGRGGDDLPEVAGLPLTPREGGATVLVVDGTTVPTDVEPMLASLGAVRITLSHNDTDPRASNDTRKAVGATPDGPVLGVGAGLGPAERLAQRVRTARHAPDLPGGGLLPFPGRRMVALYGHPETAGLGMLGEQSAPKAVERVRRLAGEYAALTDTPVVPAFEIIATVASGSSGKDGSYSRRTPIDTLRPWVEAAERAGAYVVLDLQPGRTDFLTQAKAYEELLRRPWVGLALDPEWRLRPHQVHLDQIGSVGIDEVNRVGAWLGGLVRDHDLPPKVLTLHQFSRRMIRDRERLDTSIDEVQWLVHADGLGSQGAKQGTWSALRKGLPQGVWLGWKNFEDEDSPMLSPQQTMAQVHPTPWFVSYQ
ncbi:MAG TPA: hypothetical protein VFN34_06175 [Ornithinibacter sp.]|nr:hypothetical protein [Ornithinibacter sp.]